jgi:hypothetical protein
MTRAIRPSEVARLDAISRTRALTNEESVKLERRVRGKGRGGYSNMIPGMTAKQEPALLGNHETAWRIGAEISNDQFLAALRRYFRRGGTA